MEKLPRLRPTILDSVVVLFVGLLACGILYGARAGVAAEAVTAVVYADGVEIDRVPTDTPSERTYTANGYTLHMEFCPGARVVSSDCPTQDCVHTGVVTYGGQSIVCLPARIAVRMEGGAVPSDAPDAVLG